MYSTHPCTHARTRARTHTHAHTHTHTHTPHTQHTHHHHHHCFVPVRCCTLHGPVQLQKSLECRATSYGRLGEQLPEPLFQTLTPSVQHLLWVEKRRNSCNIMVKAEGNRGSFGGMFSKPSCRLSSISCKLDTEGTGDSTGSGKHNNAALNDHASFISDSSNQLGRCRLKSLWLAHASKEHTDLLCNCTL
jgi:hypothetical protein